MVTMLLWATLVATPAVEAWKTTPMPGPMPVATEHALADVNGIKLYYATYGAGEPVILLHGGAGNGDHRANQVPVLAEKLRVIVVDSRGHGRSTRDKTPLSGAAPSWKASRCMPTLGYIYENDRNNLRRLCKSLWMRAETGPVSQVLINLLINGAQAMHRGTLRVRAWAEPGRGVIRVEDQGPGLSPQVVGDENYGRPTELRDLKNDRDSKSWTYLGTDGRSPLGELVRVGSCRHGIEQSLEMAKGDVGLDEYEVRSWLGWHHHMTLSMMALWFLVLEQRWLKKGGGRYRRADSQNSGRSPPPAANPRRTRPTGQRASPPQRQIAPPTLGAAAAACPAAPPSPYANGLIWHHMPTMTNSHSPTS